MWMLMQKLLQFQQVKEEIGSNIIDHSVDDDANICDILSTEESSTVTVNMSEVDDDNGVY